MTMPIYMYFYMEDGKIFFFQTKKFYNQVLPKKNIQDMDKRSHNYVL